MFIPIEFVWDVPEPGVRPSIWLNGSGYASYCGGFSFAICEDKCYSGKNILWFWKNMRKNNTQDSENKSNVLLHNFCLSFIIYFMDL